MAASTSQALENTHVANVETVFPKPIRPLRVALTLELEAIKETEEVCKSQYKKTPLHHTHSADEPLETAMPAPVRHVHFPPDQELATIIPDPVRRVQFAPSLDLVTIIPSPSVTNYPEDSEEHNDDNNDDNNNIDTDIPVPVCRVRFAPSPDLVTIIPDPVRRVHFAPSPDLVTFIPTPSFYDYDSEEEEEDYDDDDNDEYYDAYEYTNMDITPETKEKKQKDAAVQVSLPIPRVHFAVEPKDLRSTKSEVTIDLDTGRRLEKPGSAYMHAGLTSVTRVFSPLPTPPQTPPPTPPPKQGTIQTAAVTTVNHSPATTFSGILGHVQSDPTRDACDLERSQSIRDFVFLATHSRKRKRRLRTAFAAVLATVVGFVRRGREDDPRWNVDWC
ncbi:hypothetical protein BJX76DRAFT_356128 [Aspergillus varians]